VVKLKSIGNEGRFIVHVDESNHFQLSFIEPEIEGEREQLCNVATHLFVVGDLKFYAQMLGRTNMSGSWCMWCLMAPHEWKLPANKVPLNHMEEWTIENLKAAHLRIIVKGSVSRKISVGYWNSLSGISFL
jgi:hypothetical protein